MAISEVYMNPEMIEYLRTERVLCWNPFTGCDEILGVEVHGNALVPVDSVWSKNFSKATSGASCQIPSHYWGKILVNDSNFVRMNIA